MKDIDKIIKESIEQFEVPYNPDAWNRLSKRLDTASPSVKSASNTAKLFWIAASSVILISALSIWYLNSKDLTENKTDKLVHADQNEIKPIKVIKENKSKKSETEIKSKNQDNAVEVEVSQGINTYSKPQVHLVYDGKEKTSDDNIGTKKQENLIDYKIPSIDGSLCVGNEIQLYNPNEFEISVQYNGKIFQTISSKVTNKVKLTFAGSYSFVRKTETFATFDVKEAPKVDFVADELLYDNGLPFNHLKVIGTATNIEWTNKKGEVLSTQPEFDAHFYTKGFHEVTLKAKQDACVSVVKKSIEIETEYNLLAVTGFNPEHPDPRRQTFIPYALLVRNVSFQFSIIDPKSGVVIYSSSDASQPWDGRDKRTGDLVPLNSTYIWKVSISNPQPNEKSEYRGTIVRI